MLEADNHRLRKKGKRQRPQDEDAAHADDEMDTQSAPSTQSAPPPPSPTQSAPRLPSTTSAARPPSTQSAAPAPPHTPSTQSAPPPPPPRTPLTQSVPPPSSSQSAPTPAQADPQLPHPTPTMSDLASMIREATREAISEQLGGGPSAQSMPGGTPRRIPRKTQSPKQGSRTYDRKQKLDAFATMSNKDENAWKVCC